MARVTWWGPAGLLTLMVVFWPSASSVTGPTYFFISLNELVNLNEMICGELVCVLKTLESERTECVTFFYPVHGPCLTSWCLSFPICKIGIINIIPTWLV